MSTYKKDDMRWLPRMMVLKAIFWTIASITIVNLHSCGFMPGVPLVSTSNIAAPTAAGNGSVSTLNSPVYANTTVTSPSGADMVRACTEVFEHWYDRLDARDERTQQAWRSWFAAYRAQAEINVPADCINYATFGTPVGTGSGAGIGVGMGSFNGRSW